MEKLKINVHGLFKLLMVKCYGSYGLLIINKEYYSNIPDILISASLNYKS